MNEVYTTICAKTNLNLIYYIYFKTSLEHPVRKNNPFTFEN